MEKIFTNCPVAELRRYKIGATVSGSIISVFSSVEGLFYISDEQFNAEYVKIRSFKPTLELKNPPKFGAMFLYVDDNEETFRAYRMNSNPSDPLSIKFYLIDVGIVLYKCFAAERFFYLPDDFDPNMINPLAVFCHLEEPENSIVLKQKFLEPPPRHPVKFKVVGETKLRNAIGNRRFCLEVKIDEMAQACETFKRTEVEETHIDLDTSDYIPIKVDQMSQDYEIPEIGSKVLIYKAHNDSPSSFWACIRSQESLKKELTTEGLDLCSLMNSSKFFRKYQKLTSIPTAGDMVICFSEDNLMRRGVVTGVEPDGVIIFYVDVGETVTLSLERLFKIPYKLTQIPLQAVNITIDDLADIDFGEGESMFTRAINSELRNRGTFAEVLSVKTGISLALTVKIYKSTGEDIVESICEQFKKMQG